MAKHKVEECRKKFWTPQMLGMTNVGPFCVSAVDLTKMTQSMKDATKAMRELLNRLSAYIGKESMPEDKRFSVVVCIGDGELMSNSSTGDADGLLEHFAFDDEAETMAKFNALVEKYQDEDPPVRPNDPRDARPTMPGASA